MEYISKQKLVESPGRDEKSSQADVYTYTKNEFTVPSIDKLTKEATPSANGLYPHEILLLAYSRQARIKYMRPDATEFPRFWLHKYGVDDVPSILKSLESRGFLSVDEDRGSYITTTAGDQEVANNEYVLFIHKTSKDINLTPWTFNRLMHENNKELDTKLSWRELYDRYIKRKEAESEEDNRQSREQFIEQSRGDPKMQKLQKRLDSQDKQLKAIYKAEEVYKDDHRALILFWERLWAEEGLKFNGVKWHFRLVELYYKTKRYNDAWRVLNDFVLSKPQYITNTRKWQIKILKREKKDYSVIQKLLDSGR